METREKGNPKNFRKGGKHGKILTAEEEAKRREEIKERLREKLEFERRALKVVERLLEDSVSEEFLVDCAKFITAANYKDTIEERFISKLCGYPVCPNKLGKIPTQQYKISTKTNKVYDITEWKCFCCNFCYKASKEFELQISKTPLWLRQHENPEEIKLSRRGDGGSSGQEVILKERPLKEEDIENLSATLTEDPYSSQHPSGEVGHGNSDISDGEQEQDFVSSIVVSQQQRPRVHWSDQLKHTVEDVKLARGKKGQCHQEQAGAAEERKASHMSSTDIQSDVDAINPDHSNLPADDPDVRAVIAQIGSCSFAEKAGHNPLPADSTLTEAGHILAPQADIKNPRSSTLTSSNEDMVSPYEPIFNITQVGMSRRGAAGLQSLLEAHTEQNKPHLLRHSLINSLKRTLNDWCTDETLKFLYGDDHPLASPFTDVKEGKDQHEEEEELDEDDLQDELPAVNARQSERPSAASPNYDTLRREAEQMELRVREFYQGTFPLNKEVNGNKGHKMKDPSLPLTDSQAQHIIQKKITVEKLSGCLRNIVSPLRLTMSDVSTHLNHLVRTFRLTNTNITHKTPEWTLIAVILLHLLSEVSPVVRGALERSTSVEYLNTLMEELGLHQEDLLNLVHLFKSPAETAACTK